jgi:uncharacterized protein YecE (DUF72 family)
VSNQTPLSYYRLHGSPQIYRSKNSEEVVHRLTEAIRQDLPLKNEAWRIFDNTMFSHSIENAHVLQSQFAAKSIVHAS